jgi:hypothetical protein
MTSDLPGDPISDPASEPLESPDEEEELPPDSAPKPEEKILDKGRSQTPEDPA